ncbi:hypothetical protein EJ03DRAFT_305450 [Teratosphaeria nubilosa]|uniref:endo-polygalacturonase n=1 Tax=Teratosphaeria nubilosa TaxID=161662 RepID=A0A6G1LJY2_9PEZI|nr:hypothetical protein EJ03DRAFT_305450 [Teratosphaeria nubilosa]
MRYAQASFAAAVLPAALACVDPKTHACASAFHNNLASAQEFCATYTAGSAASVPSLFSSACNGEAKSLSKECTCYATGSAAIATSTPAPVYTSANATGSIASTFVTATSAAAASSVPSATSAASNYSAAATTTAAVKVAATAAGGTAISSLTGGSGVGGTTCTVTELADVTASLESCSNILMSGVSIPASSTLSVEVSSDAALLFAGTMTVAYTPDTDYTPIVIKGTGAKVAGLAGAVIDGNGAQYWDGEGSNGGTDKPDHFIKIDDMEDSTFSDITIQNWPTHLFEITGCSNMEMYNLILDNSAGDEEDSDGDALGHNTDAFDVSSTDGLYVHDATVYNQDDCTAVNSGSNMVFENLYCSGGHGLSIGSIDSDVTVSNITFKDSTVINSENGCRIKTDADATDSTVSDITYSNIYLSGITDYAIDVQQDYENGGSTGDPGDSITISGVTFEDITGSVSGDDAYQYYILCGSTSSCSDFTWSGLDISGGQTECSPDGDECPS